MNSLNKYHDLLTVKEVAEILRVSKDVVYGMVKKDQIKCYRFGREFRIPKAWLIENFVTA